MKPDYAHNMRIVGHSDQGGYSDGVQVMVSRGFAYVGHAISGGFLVIDVRNPRAPKFVIDVPRRRHLESASADSRRPSARRQHEGHVRHQSVSSHDYSPGSIGEKINLSEAARHSAGMRVFNIADRANPREIAFMPLEGLGVHRIWYVGGRWA